ncbi:MAG: ThiF family adenylyltransferase [Methanobacterium sp.]
MKKGRRALDGISEVELLQDWQYDRKSEKWFMQIKITADVEGEIPQNSTWYVVAEENYPGGTIKIYPDSGSACTLTFEHQSNNGIINENGLWTNGSLCLDTQFSHVGNFKRYDPELQPLDVDWRLWWHVKRAIDWINDANSNTLAVAGEPFELPQFNDKPLYCIFSEDYGTFERWKSQNTKYGIVKLDLYKIYFVIKEFKTAKRITIHKVDWGKFLTENFKDSVTGIWILFEEIPVVNKWQAPNSLNDLIHGFGQKKEGKVKINLVDIFRRVIKENQSTLRDGKAHLILIGFPIPEKIGDQNSIIHWQAFRLPALSADEVTGFRDAELYWSKRDEHHALSKKQELEWFKSQNWSIEKITNRGQLPNDIRLLNTVIIGAGTIGAAIAELIVRAGVTDISIIDDDILEIGNLSRHCLKLKQLGCKKSKELARYLNEINPHVKAEGIDKKFKFTDEFVKILQDFDLIIDCTGEDFVLDEIEKFEFATDKIFVSVSIGIGAELLYLSLQKGKKIQLDNFREKVSAWIERDKIKLQDYDLPRDGVNCWSPTFPARYDDILQVSSASIKIIENFIRKHEQELDVVYQRFSEDENFLGYQRIE